MRGSPSIRADSYPTSLSTLRTVERRRATAWRQRFGRRACRRSLAHPSPWANRSTSGNVKPLGSSRVARLRDTVGDARAKGSRGGGELGVIERRESPPSMSLSTSGWGPKSTNESTENTQFWGILRRCAPRNDSYRRTRNKISRAISSTPTAPIERTMTSATPHPEDDFTGCD